MEKNLYIKMAKAQNTHWWFAGRRLILEKVIRKIELPVNAKILEIGAGTGSNLKMLSNFGDVTAVESDDYARSLCVKSNCKTIFGKLPNDINIGTKYDLVCLFDVLEHVNDDQLSVDNIKKLITDDGSLLITCPAYQFLYGRYDMKLGHYRRYTSHQLQDILIQSGYIIEKSGYFNTILFPLIVLFKIFEIIGFNGRNIGFDVPNKYINYTLRKILSFESKIISKKLFPFGTSVLIQAKIRHA
jgi:SAM-dependent methyltransferase